MAVMWYGALHQNNNDRSQPLATVLFHEVKDGKLYGEFHCLRVSALNLGILPIGSVWHEGKMVARAKFVTKQFKVDFSQNGWTHYTLNKDKHPLIPPSVYPLFQPCRNDIAESWLLKFYLANGKFLLIPSLEFFTRCYGSSSLRRCFLTLPWNETENRLFPQPEEPLNEEAQNKWAILLPRASHKSDIHILSHIKYDRYAKSQAQHIVAQTLSNDVKNRIFLKVSPWFNKKGKINVSGFYVRETKTFVALNILGIGLDSYPPYLIYNYHTTTNTPPDEETSLLSSSTSNSGEEYSDPELLDNESPNKKKGLTKILEPDFQWIDEPPIPSKKIERKGSQKRKNKDSENEEMPNHGSTILTEELSTGEAYGTNSNAAEALTHSKQPTESVDKLWSIWNTILKVAENNTDSITGVYHYDITNGFCKSGHPRLINFPLSRTKENSPDVNQSNETTKKIVPQHFQLVYGNPKKRRGLLLARISLSNTNIYILEIQHRTDISGESFAGLAFTFSAVEDFDTFLHTLIEKIISDNGHVSSIAKNWKDGKAIAYSHREPPKYLKITMPENTVRMIFEKMSRVLGLSLFIKFTTDQNL